MELDWETNKVLRENCALLKEQFASEAAEIPEMSNDDTTNILKTLYRTKKVAKKTIDDLMALKEKYKD